MQTSIESGLSGRSAAGNKRRRPQGVSRRQKRRLGFETLEDRRVMSADTGVAVQSAAVLQSLQLQTGSLSTDTLEGYLAILQNELLWQSLTGTSGSIGALSGYQTFSIPTDPLLARQWHLINTGQEVGNPDWQPIYATPGEDINVAGAWNLGYTGAGVVVAVIDSGVQTLHPDLAANIHPTLSLDPIDRDANANPALQNPINAHGTSVAGIIAAVANNGLGGTGIAPGALIVPIRLIDPAGTFFGTEQSFIDTFRYAIQDIDITNNSWGSTAVRGLAPMSAGELSALRDSVFFGRGGLGVIHVFASGNDAGPDFDNSGPDPLIDFLDIGGYDSATYDGWNNSRYTISVTGVDHDGFYNNVDGTVTAYPEAGPGVLVAAPTGSNAGLVIINDYGLGSGIVTTDTTGNFGFNAAPNPITGAETEDPFFPFDRDFLLDTDYTTRFNGTSAAAPMVSGVIALMLEANPNLSWRDVQEILVRSARQNAPYETPQNGLSQGLQITTQNLWLINQMPLFQAPDPYNPAIPPAIQTLAPTSDPNIFTQSIHDRNAPTVSSYTNGAGYTVSQGIGIYGEQIGYGHGVVDATLAVQLAAQWSSKGQTLPSERTFTTFVSQPEGPDLNIPGAERGSQASGFQIVPGKLGGQSGFIAFWNEYFDDDPDFSQTFPAQGTDLKLNVPLSQNMSVETVEVKLSISGDQASALDHLRIVLVSPSGVQSELNHFWVEPPATPFTLINESPATVYGEPGSIATAPGNLVYTFTTNRNWGERTDRDIVFDATTGLPVVDQTGILNLSYGGTELAGSAFSRGWTLVIENYGFGDTFGLAAAEVAWHGSPIGANTKRIQGVIGVDTDRDNAFNFNRVTPTLVSEIDGDPSVIRFGEYANELDASPLLTGDRFASNVTVIARRASDGVVVDRFVTGADGNYYFDLVPDDYIISIEDAAGRTAVEDTLTGAGLLQKYKTEWTITADFFKVWNRDANLNVPVDASGTPIPWLDGNGAETAYHVKEINFLLDPGAPAAPQAEFSGVIFADTNGDGIYNGDDILMPNVVVFGDINRNGVRDAGEPIATTNASGAYNLIVPIASASVINVSVDTPANWTITSPSSGLETRFANLGDSFTGIDFAIAPPLNSAPGVGINQPGILLGVVYEDSIVPLGSRQAGEAGVPGITVYIDVNNSGVLDAGDISTVTNEHGAFVFTNVAPQNNISVRIVTVDPYSQIVPFSNGPYLVNLASGDTFSGIQFGVKNSATMDFGDLPAIYGMTTLAQNGARHLKGNYYLGALIDAESDGQPSLAATGDDLAGFDDDDGITIAPLVAGVNTMTVVASRNGGYLTAWIDFNGDGDFNDPGERLVMTRNGVSSTKTLLSAGANEVSFVVPDGVVAANVYARFRYGEFSIDSPFGPAQIGEVEDYLLPVAAVSVISIPDTADFDADGFVNGSDFLAWQRFAGKPSGSNLYMGDGNSDGAVDGADLAVWQDLYGTGGAAAPSGVFASPTESGGVSTASTWEGVAEGSLAGPAPAGAATLTHRQLVGLAQFPNKQEQLPEAGPVLRSEILRQSTERRAAAREEADSVAGSRRDDAFGEFAASRRGIRREREQDFKTDEVGDDAFAAALAGEEYWLF
ncbi:MAG: S8 family serine peptidase [Pirellulales bacterium]|nr:S8 family serine peptidase [Pirellulales bacterium]